MNQYPVTHNYLATLFYEKNTEKKLKAVLIHTAQEEKLREDILISQDGIPYILEGDKDIDSLIEYHEVDQNLKVEKRTLMLETYLIPLLISQAKLMRDVKKTMTNFLRDLNLSISLRDNHVESEKKKEGVDGQ